MLREERLLVGPGQQVGEPGSKSLIFLQQLQVRTERDRILALTYLNPMSILYVFGLCDPHGHFVYWRGCVARNTLNAFEYRGNMPIVLWPAPGMTSIIT